MWYELKQKQQKTAESTSEHLRIQQYAIFRFNFGRRKNCTVWWYQELYGLWYEIGQASLFRATERPIHAKRELKHTERGTQHCNSGRPTPACDPYRPNRKYSLVPVSNNYSLVIHEWSPPQFPCRTWTGAPEDHLFFIISPTTVPPRTSSSCCLSLFKEASYTQTTSAEVPVLHTPVEVAEMKWQVYRELPGMW